MKPPTYDELLAFVRAFLALERETVLWARAEALVGRAEAGK